MTTLHKAVQMALDALDAITDDVDGTGLNTMPSFDKALDAIATLREALNAPEPEPVARCILDNGDEMGSVEWLVRPRSIRLDHGSLLYAAPPAAPDHFRDVAEKVAPAAPVPDGLVMVPMEPTPEMIAAMPYPANTIPAVGVACYRAMIAAHGITGAGK